MSTGCGVPATRVFGVDEITGFDSPQPDNLKQAKFSKENFGRDRLPAAQSYQQK